MIQPDSGKIRMKGTEIQRLKGKKLAGYRGKEIGYLFQNFELLDNLTGRENIMVPLSIHNISEAEGGKRLEQLAEYLEITDVLDKFPSQMSGGQKQRLAAARALILNPGIILADEPTGALDSRNAKALMEKLAGLNRDDKTTVLMVTHDSNAASYCKRILFIQDGVIFHELRRDLLAETQQQFYERILQVMAQLGGAAQMFFKLIRKNSKRNRKENGLFFSSLVISIVAFYIILSLSSQDVMVFLKKMESDAVDRLFQIIPAFL